MTSNVTTSVGAKFIACDFLNSLSGGPIAMSPISTGSITVTDSTLAATGTPPTGSIVTNGGEYVTANVIINAHTPASNVPAAGGALMVTGGERLGGNLIVNAPTVAAGGAPPTGAVVVAGGAHLTKNLIVASATPASVGPAAGALVVTGGQHIGDNLIVTDDTTLSGGVFLGTPGTPVGYVPVILTRYTVDTADPLVVGGCNGVIPDVIVRVVNVGNMVTITSAAQTAALSKNGAGVIALTGVPAHFKPATAVDFVLHGFVGGVFATLYGNVGTDSVIRIGKYGGADTLFANLDSVVIGAFTVTYAMGPI